MHIGTVSGVRVEALSVAMPPTSRHIVLQPSNGFADGGVRVRLWGADRCALTFVKAEEEEDFDVEAALDAADAEEAEECRGGKRHRVMAPLPPPNKRQAVDAEWLLDMTDECPDERVAYIWLLPTTASSCCCRSARSELPYPPHSFRIENTCGACRLEEPLDRAWLRPFMIETQHAPLIATLSGTFAPCARHDMQVDFRGVRSIAAAATEWDALTRGRAPVRLMTTYMIVLKANLGLPVLLVDEGALPPGLVGEGARRARMGRGICFLAERMAPWCPDFTQNLDMCFMLQLHGLDWGKLFPSDVAEPLLRARTSMQISRRGGLTLKLLFTRSTTAWTTEVEAAVVRDCNRLLAGMQRLLAGKVSF